MIVTAGDVCGHWSGNRSRLSMFDSEPDWCYQNDKDYYKTVMAQLCVKSDCSCLCSFGRSTAFYIHNQYHQGIKPLQFWRPCLWGAASHTKQSYNRITITVSQQLYTQPILLMDWMCLRFFGSMVMIRICNNEHPSHEILFLLNSIGCKWAASAFRKCMLANLRCIAVY